MDVIQLKVEPSQEADYSVLNIYVNQQPFIEWVKSYEMQFEPDIAGGYEGLDIEDFIDLEAHFLGRLTEDDRFNMEGKIQLLGCNCGIPGCWPFLVKITVHEDTIAWSDYEQPYRSEDSAGGHWNYSRLAPLEFDRQQYEEELQHLTDMLARKG